MIPGLDMLYQWNKSEAWWINFNAWQYDNAETGQWLQNLFSFQNCEIDLLSEP